MSASDDALEYIRGYYGVPAYKGAKVKYQGKEATIKGGKGAYLVLEFPGEKTKGNYHPTWEMEYL